MSSHRLKTGFYSYRANTGIAYLDNHLYYNSIPEDAIFVLPSTFHQIVNDFDGDELATIICSFNADNPLLLDLSHTHSIRGLYDCL